MNNRGFTLIEVLSALVLVVIVAIVCLNTFGTTMSASKEEAYKLMKNNIVSAGYDYINECNLGTIECNFSFENNNKFNAVVLQNFGFFKSLESPIDGKNLGDCLVLEATKSHGVTVINLIDNCYSNSDNNVPVIKDNETTESENNDLVKPNDGSNNNLGNSNNGNNGNSNNGNNGNSNNGNNGNSLKDKDDKHNVWNEILDFILDMIVNQ